MNSNVNALVVSGSDVYAGGDFTTAGGSAANYLAKWNGTNWTALGSGMGGVDSPSVFALAISGSDMYAGGLFTTAGGRVSAFVAKWVLPLVFDPNRVAVSNGTFRTLLSGPESNRVVVDGSATLSNWTPVVTNTLPVGGWPLSFPLGTNAQQFYRARFE